MKTTILTVLIGILLLSACQTSNDIKIGWIGPVSGQSAVLGMDSITAAEIAVQDVNANGGINGKTLTLIAEDDQYDTKKTISAYEKLVNIDGVKVIMISTYSGVFALAERAKEDGVIIIDPLDCNELIASLNENVFCLATASETIADVIAESANTNQDNKIGILYWNNDQFMPYVASVLKERYSGEIVIKESYTASTKDFKTLLGKMISQNVDGIVLLGYDETGIAMKQARELGFTGTFYTTGTITSPSLQEVAEGNAEGTIFAFWDAPKDVEPSKSFTEAFIASKGRPAILDLASYPTYDTVMAIAQAYKTAKSEKANDFASALLGVQDMEGVTGKVSFNENGGVLITEKPFKLVEGMPVPFK
ncbi:MAG: ABC transporter substrate-binding protein [Candidatus Woesearchaeota archaeon]